MAWPETRISSGKDCHAHPGQFFDVFLGGAGRVIRCQDKRNGALTQEGKEFAQAGHGLVAPVKDAVHVNDEVSDFRE